MDDGEGERDGTGFEGGGRDGSGSSSGTEPGDASLLDGAALDEAAFLVRSPHRIRVLELLASGPATRAELAARIDVSRVTLGRSLGELEERTWIERVDGRYRVGPSGELVLSATLAFLGALETERRLRDVLDMLPTASGVDLRRLGDADVVPSTRHDPGAPLRRYLELVADAAELLVVKDTVDVGVARVVTDRVDAGALSATVVYSPAAVETTLRLPEARRLMRRDLANGKRAYRHPGPLPHHLAVVDDAVLLFLLDDRGLQGLVETRDPVVREWAVETIAALRAASEPLDAATFRDEPR